MSVMHVCKRKQSQTASVKVHRNKIWWSNSGVFVHRIHIFKPYHFLRIKLSLVRIVFLQANQRQVLTFRDILAFQRGSTIALRTPEE